MMKKPIIIHLVNSNIYSGLENVAIEIIEKLNEKYDFYYACKDGEIEEKLKEKNIKRIRIKKISLREILRIEREYKPDIIHAHDYKASLFCGFFVKKTNIISHLHNNSPWLKKWWHIYNYMFYFSLKNKLIYKVLTVSNSIQNEFIFSSVIKNKIQMIGNPIDIKKFEKYDINNVEKEYDVCFCGRLTKQKNPLRFIQIIKKIVEIKPELKVVMIGDGELKEQCKEKIKKMNLDSNIDLKGFLNNPYDEMVKSKILCLTSEWEGFGLVAIEAICLNIPCVVSNVGGLKEIVTSDMGFLCDTDDDFVNNIIYMLNNNNFKKMMKKDKSKYEENIKNYMNCIKDNYDNCLKELEKK